LFKGEAKKDSLSFLKDGLNYLQEKLTAIYNDLHVLKKESDRLYLIKQNLQNRLNGVNADLGEQDISSIYKTNHQITVSIISDVATTASISVNYFVNTAG
jgi:chromosome segregation ATPase